MMHSDENVRDGILGYYLNGQWKCYTKKELTICILNSDRQIERLKSKIKELENEIAD